MPAQNNPNETSEAAERAKTKEQRSQETSTPGQIEMDAIEMTKSSELRETNKKLTEKENAERPENNLHIRGRPIQPKESDENDQVRPRYEAEPETWQCTQREKKYAETDARGAAAHVAIQTTVWQKIRRQQEQRPSGEMPTEDLMKQEYASCYNMDKKNGEY